MLSSNALLAAIVASVAAKTIEIDVGEGGLVFSPDSTTADVGDTIEFHFFASFHTAVQGDFNTPCQRGSLESSGFNSGPINNKADGSVRTTHSRCYSNCPSIMLISITREAFFKSRSRTPNQCGFTAAHQAIARAAWLG